MQVSVLLHTDPFSLGGQLLKIQVGSLIAQKDFGTRHTKESFFCLRISCQIFAQQRKMNQSDR